MDLLERRKALASRIAAVVWPFARRIGIAYQEHRANYGYADRTNKPHELILMKFCAPGESPADEVALHRRQKQADQDRDDSDHYNRPATGAEPGAPPAITVVINWGGRRAPKKMT